MTRRLMALALASLVVVPATAHAGEAFRSTRYDHGEWIATNGIHQALGANTDGLHRTDYFSAIAVPGDPTGDTNDVSKVLTYNFFGVGRAARNGDFRLPTDAARYPDGTADLAELHLRLDGDALVARFVWNAMPRPDAQIATLTFATAGTDTATRPWPRNAGVRSPWEAAVTVWGTGATLTSGSDAERPITASAGDHVTEARIPLAALPPGPWRLTGGSGLNDAAAPGTYRTVPAGPATSDAPGGGGSVASNVWDLLFADDVPWTFDERAQADMLARGDVTAAHEDVDPRLMRVGATRAAPERTGDLSRMFVSRIADGDGIDKIPGLDATTVPPDIAKLAPHTGGFETWIYHGRLQDYAMHVPASYPGTGHRWPLLLYLHGFGGNPDEAFYLPLGLVARADKEGYLVASIRGRGDLFYTGAGDVDVMEVLHDVEAHYAVDPDRVYLMGHSMGGYGTNNVATHHPDLFAAVAPMEGTSSADLAGNLRNVPWFEVSADEDLDAGGTDAKAMYDRLSAAGYDATLLIYHLKIHEYSSIYDTLDDLFAFFGRHRRVRNPAVVSWTSRPGDDDPKLGLAYDGAYWVGGVRAADVKQPATVTATSLAIPHRSSDPQRAQRSHDNVDTGGPSGRTTAQRYRTIPDAGAPVPLAQRLTLTAKNAGALVVNARRARLRAGRRRALVVTVDSDRAMRLTLSGLGARTVRRRIDGGRALRRRPRGGRLTFALPAGRHTLSLRR